MRGKLNLFQAAMLRWRELYPYNAVHVAELPGTLDPKKLEDAIAAHLSSLGVVGLTIDEPNRCFEYAGGPARVALPVLAGGTQPLGVIEREMERHLNEPFACTGTFEPFRFFAVAASESFHLGVAYDHLVAGGDSIVALLEGIAARYDGNVPAGKAPDLYPPTYRRLFWRNAPLFGLTQYLVPAMLMRVRRAFRPRYPHGDSWYNGFTSFELPPDLYAALMRSAKSWGLTFNDILIAMLLTAIAPEVPERFTARRRKEIGIASVINLRREIAGGTEETFGQFLSSFLVSHAVPAGATVESLARDIHAQTSWVKRRKLYLHTLHLIFWGGVAWPYMTPSQRKEVHGKNFPVWAGVSTLNVEAMWRSTPGGARVLHYLRAVSTGPFMPLLIAPAAVGDCLHIGVSFRVSAFSPEDVARIMERLVSCARSLA